MRVIYYQLGLSSYCQGKYDKAPQFFRRAEKMDGRWHTLRVLQRAYLLTNSLLRLGQTAEALETLQQLLDWIETDGRAGIIEDEAALLNANSLMNDLCDEVAGFDELQGIVERLRGLRTDLDLVMETVNTAGVAIGEDDSVPEQERSVHEAPAIGREAGFEESGEAGWV